MHVTSLAQFLISSAVVPTILGCFTLFAFFSLTTLYYLLDLNASFVSLQTPLNSSLFVFDFLPQNFLLHTSFIGLHLVDIYTFPFIYIFVVVTLLSILFCLAYNIHELSSFMLYCTLILLAGYIVFFTSSLILFFFAYEMLLIPSFFILYNFAKTRRCVEAAYLMFF